MKIQVKRPLTVSEGVPQNIPQGYDRWLETATINAVVKMDTISVFKENSGMQSDTSMDSSYVAANHGIFPELCGKIVLRCIFKTCLILDLQNSGASI